MLKIIFDIYIFILIFLLLFVITIIIIINIHHNMINLFIKMLLLLFYYNILFNFLLFHILYICFFISICDKDIRYRCHILGYVGLLILKVMVSSFVICRGFKYLGNPFKRLNCYYYYIKNINY
jgi:hypothetical protein